MFKLLSLDCDGIWFYARATRSELFLTFTKCPLASTRPVPLWYVWEKNTWIKIPWIYR